MGKTKIETAEYTWNPVTGCMHGCEYCYARKIAHRFGNSDITPNEAKSLMEGALGWEKAIDFGILENGIVVERPVYSFEQKLAYPFGFIPTFLRYRLKELPKNPSIIFVCSMGDLFGEWVPSTWILEVLNACVNNPQHIYQFYTKNPVRYNQEFIRYSVAGKRNMWMGTSITGESDKSRVLELVNGVTYNTNTFLSIEPLLEPIDLGGLWLCEIEWVIIGAMTGPGAKKQAPKREWVAAIVDQCRAMGVPVFLKNSLVEIWGGPLIQEWPKKMRPPVAVE